MTFDQIASAASRGKRRKGIPVTSRDEVLQMARQWRRYVP